MDGFQLKKTLDDIIWQAYPQADFNLLRAYKGYYVQIVDKVLKSKHGDYNMKTHRIRIFNASERDPVQTICTAIHELSHHIDFCNRRTTDHQPPFYEAFRKLLYAGIDLGVFNAEQYLDTVRDASDFRKVQKIVSGYVKKETGYKAGLKRIDVSGAYQKREDLKDRGYRFDSVTKDWFLEIGEDRVESETDWLFRSGLKFTVREVGEVSFVNENAKKVPDGWCGHQFTKDEKAILESGGSIYADDFWSDRTRKVFACSLKWANGKFDPDFSGIKT